MDFTSKDDLLDFEECLFEDLSPHGPTRARRRQSDAKWRASVATCYDTLKHVVPKGHRASKRKVSKAVILQESERHIMQLETVLSRLIGTESQASGKTVLWKGDKQWEKCTLKHFQDDFTEKQHKIFYSVNQGRRCYNLMDEIKEEIFSVKVDPNCLSIVDKDDDRVPKCVEKVNKKGVSRFSQFPIDQGKVPPTTVTMKVCRNSLDASKQKLQQECVEKPSFGTGYLSDDLMIERSEREDQTVPSISSTTLTTPSHRGTLNDIASQLNSSKMTAAYKLPSLSLDDNTAECSGGYTVHVAGRIGKRSSLVTLGDDENVDDDSDGDQEVPSFEKSCPVLHSDEISGHFSVHFLDKLSKVSADVNTHTPPTSNVTREQSRKTLQLVASTPTSGEKKDDAENNVAITPANTVSFEAFKSKNLEGSSVSMLRSIADCVRDPANKPKTARKLNFNRPECVRRIHQKLLEQQSNSLCQGTSPMLAGFTPIKLSPNVSHCVTCKRPDESLISPWKSLHSPLYGESCKKPQEKSPMIDPDNSLFCFETIDDSVLDDKDDIEDQRTPAVHSVNEDNKGIKQAFKRKLTCKSLDLLGKHQPKCRKKLDGFFDTGECKGLNSNSTSRSSKAVCDGAQIVPDCSNELQGEKEEEIAAFVDLTQVGKHNADAVDFDGFFFYFRQIGQQLKDQQKLSRQEILSPCVAAKVMNMWMRLPSPDKQTIKTLALLDSQEGVGSLTQDLHDVDVEPIDLKEFIPTTLV